MDKILVKDLLVRGIIGINDWEREKKQDILINLVIYSDLRNISKDNIDETINYRDVTKSVIDLVESTEYFLVETLANEIAKLCLLNYPTEKVLVRVEKPMALRFAKSVGVEIERTKKDYV